MATALAHRGPDDAGVEVVGSVGLVNTRLAIVDPGPAGHQPMSDGAGRWWITYNGEVFNHAELRAELPPAEYRGTSDTETLLHALGAWGEEAPGHCNGLFAFAALDTARRRLLLVRDRFGVKPLYVARHDGVIWFASEIAALLAAGIPRRARPDIVERAIGAGWANGPATPLDGVTRVLPGTLVSIDLDTLEASERRWYRPAEAVDPERARALAALDEPRLADALEEELRRSVHRRLMADVPIGALCSGGLDSSLVTALAAAERPDLHLFHAGVVDQPDADERRWAAQVAAHCGLEHHVAPVSARTWRRDLVSVVRHLEYPLTHVASVPISQVAALARSHGVKVLLTGEGSDELFGGYAVRHWDAYADFFARRSPYRRARRAASRVWDAARSAPPRAPSVWEARTPSPPEVSAHQADVLDAARGAYAHHRGSRRQLEASLLTDLGLYLPHLLNSQDKANMRSSVEARLPFLDPEVVALTVNLPLEARVEPVRKHALRLVAARHLPAEVANRPKHGFWFDARRYLIDATRPAFLADGRLRQVLGVGRADWEARMAAVRADAGLGASYNTTLHWTAEIWCRTVLDGEPVEAVEEALWREPGA